MTKPTLVTDLLVQMADRARTHDRALETRLRTAATASLHLETLAALERETRTRRRAAERRAALLGTRA